MAIRQRLLAVLGLLAVLAGAPVTARAAVVLINGTVTYTSLFGVSPPRAVVAYGDETVMGALNIPQIPQHFSSMMTTDFQTGVVISFMNTRKLTGFGPGQLAAGFQPGGFAQPKTFAPGEQLPIANINLNPSLLRVGFKSAAGNHFGGVLALAGFEKGTGLFQLSPAELIQQVATRPFPAGGVVGAAPTKRAEYSPQTNILAATPNRDLISVLAGSESRIGFPWTTGSISAVAGIGNPVPYGGAGNIGTPMQATAPINFRTVAGFDGRVFNAGLGKLTGNLQLVSPMVQIANYGLSGSDSLAPFWELTVNVVPEPGAVSALAAGLALVAVAGIRRIRS